MLLDFLGGRVSGIAFIFVLVAIVIAIAIHEYSHALSASLLGDPTPRLRGRLTLDPSVHVDKIGFLMLLLVGFGWGKPVPVNTTQIRHGRRGVALVSLAGPLSNLLLAVLFGLGLRFQLFPMTSLMVQLVFILININVGLAVFNLLPFGPLDGYKIFVGLLPAKLAYQLTQLRHSQNYLWIMLAIIFFFEPVYRFVLNIFYRLVLGA